MEMSIFDGAGVFVHVRHDPDDAVRVIDEHRRPEHRVDRHDLRPRRPAVDHRPEIALAHDARHDRSGEALLARHLVVREATAAPADLAAEALDVLKPGIRREGGQLGAEFDIADRRDGFLCRLTHWTSPVSRCALSAFATCVPS